METPAALAISLMVAMVLFRASVNAKTKEEYGKCVDTPGVSH
jgi:hypothetical protein